MMIKIVQNIVSVDENNVYDNTRYPANGQKNIHHIFCILDVLKIQNILRKIFTRLHIRNKLC